MKLFNFEGKFKSNFILWVTSALSVFMVCALAFAAYAKIQEKAENSKHNSCRTVVLDAGHGGEDGGAVGVDGIIEKNINLSISLKLKDFLECAGFKVVMTRDKDEAVYDANCESLREKKRSDLHNRAKIIKDNSAENVIFVSVHQNKFPDSKYFGTQIFYSKNNSKSQNLAEKIKESVVGLIQPENTREIKPADKRIYLLNNSDIPAIVVECGFLSNKEEALKLSDENYQSQMAFCIYCGITGYFLNMA